MTGKAKKHPASTVNRGTTVGTVGSQLRGRRTARTASAQERTTFLMEALGGGASLARLLSVSRSQPLRWSTGAEAPHAETWRVLIDLDHVMARAGMLWSAEVALEWLEGSNSYLDGARPIDVLSTRGSSEVVEALDAAMAGASS